MKPATTSRQALFASLLIAGTTMVSTGCSRSGFSLASMNPFAKPATPSDSGLGGATGTLASAKLEPKSQLSSVGTSAKNAVSKTGNAIAGVFGRGKPTTDEAATDPLSLSNKPKKVEPEVFVLNGQMWESTGNVGKAMESYTKALESQPDHPQALANIARLHLRQGNQKLAVDFFQRAVAKSPDDASLHNDLGLTQSKLGEHAGAIKSLSKAIELAPGTSRYANNLASVQFDAGQTAAALDVLTKSNKPAVAHFNMAYLHFKSGQMDAARTHLNKVLQQQPQAESDPAVQQAIERSREMLAQIETSMSPVAHAAPQATIAGAPLFGTTAQPAVQQASRSLSSPAGVVPAAIPSLTTPAGGWTGKSPSASPLTISEPAATTSSALQISAPAPAGSATAPLGSPAGAWGNAGVNADAARPMPVKPAAPTSDAAPPALPYVLPGGFMMPK